MTSYQNVSESQISGYNDCPIIDYSKKTSSKPKRRIISHSLAQLALNVTAEKAQTSAKLPPPLPSDKPLVAPKKTDSLTNIASKDTETTMSNEEFRNEINVLLSKPSNLQDREFSHYSNKLQDCLKKGLMDSQKVMVIKNIKEFNPEELINFMLNNDGASSWCLPLRKILENVQK